MGNNGSTLHKTNSLIFSHTIDVSEKPIFTTLQDGFPQPSFTNHVSSSRDILDCPIDVISTPSTAEMITRSTPLPSQKSKLFKKHFNTKRVKQLPIISKSVDSLAHLDYSVLCPTTERLSNLVHLETPQVIYNSEIDGLSAREFNSKVFGKGNVMVLVTLKTGETFGCYQKCPMSFEQKFSNETFFVFNTTNYIPLKRKIENNAPETILHQNNEPKMVFTCNGAFWVVSDSLVFFHPAIKSLFGGSTKIGNPLCSASLYHEAQLESLIVVQWV
ncbi:hypothetical protein EIN_378370 [Entamoeba invadens IP1]|uniref:TLDc domain-containing protein n=1 Tax=Entamoeba invadens IP1 TaxID=370355 RepID=A0A0A1TU90_ENTIV|nr:hypothetical protein EIN_378370 [Entamoeba invadens IP1]ELP83532.1 hypothetical protein EIN_378370 [Entamoeba invadens IP1]|eukprot:XP_004182878.1 hypothetical protein EIN_378370 [Entamoeba invadens IP1]